MKVQSSSHKFILQVQSLCTFNEAFSFMELKNNFSPSKIIKMENKVMATSVTFSLWQTNNCKMFAGPSPACWP
jgi:hypothetical protein